MCDDGRHFSKSPLVSDFSSEKSSLQKVEYRYYFLPLQYYFSKCLKSPLDFSKVLSSVSLVTQLLTFHLLSTTTHNRYYLLTCGFTTTTTTGVYEFTCGAGNKWFASREQIKIKQVWVCVCGCECTHIPVLSVHTYLYTHMPVLHTYPPPHTHTHTRTVRLP